MTRAEVVPADRSGVTVDLRVHTTSTAAVVAFRTAAGAFMPAGAGGVLDATGEPFVIGYDGRAFIRNLSATNTVTVTGPDGVCSAAFGFEPKPNQQVLIDGVICQ